MFGKDDCFYEAESAAPAIVLLTPPRLTKFPPLERLLLPPALLPPYPATIWFEMAPPPTVRTEETSLVVVVATRYMPPFLLSITYY